MNSVVMLKNDADGSTKDTYLQSLLHQGDRRQTVAENDFLVKLRQQGSNQVKQSRLPHKRDEEWLFTDLSDLVKVDFQPAQPMTLNREVLSQFILEEATQTRLVFVNGIYAPELSDLRVLPQEVLVGNLGN